MEANWLTVTEAKNKIQQGMLTPTHLVEACLQQIHKNNPIMNTFITVMEDEALEQAHNATQAIKRGENWGALHGIPIAIKDLIDVEGVPTTAASRFFADNIPNADASVVTHLKSAGAIIIGKTHLHEFAIGATNLNPHYGPARNPWNPDYITGGSSGGSAAAVAGGMALAALGTDTGGSIRIPSALCNLTGLRPGKHQISSEGVVPMSWTLDAVGPMVRSVDDIVLLADVLMNRPTRMKSLDEPLNTLRFGFPDNSEFWRDVSTEIVILIRNAAETFIDLDMEQIPIDLHQIQDIYRAAGIISITEALGFHYDRLQRWPDKFGFDVRQRLQSGLHFSGVEYGLARQRGRIWRSFLDDIFKDVDVLLLPVTPITAVPITEATNNTSKQLLQFNYPFSLSSLPCLVIPCGFSEAGLPVGMQLVAKSLCTLYQVSSAYQHITEWHKRKAAR